MIVLTLLLIEGILAKFITGIDDVLTQTPIIAALAKTKKGKLIFITGMFLSIITLIILSILFADLLQNIKYKNIFSAGLLLIIAGLLFFNKLQFKKYRQKINVQITTSKSLKLFGLGFATFFITGIDDAAVYSALLNKNIDQQIIVGVGILTAAILEFLLLFYFSKLLKRIKYAKIISITGLIILALLVGFKII